MKKLITTTAIAAVVALSLSACGKKEPPKQAGSQVAASAEQAPQVTPVKVGKLAKNYHPRYVEGLCTYEAKGSEILWFKNQNTVILNLNGKDVPLTSSVPRKGNMLGKYTFEGNDLTLTVAGKGTYSEGIGSNTPLLLKVEAGDNVQNIKLAERCSD